MGGFAVILKKGPSLTVRGVEYSPQDLVKHKRGETSFSLKNTTKFYNCLCTECSMGADIYRHTLYNVHVL
jgi:hypothetical protein